MARSPVLLDVMDTLVVDPFHDAIPAFFDTDLASYLEAKRPGVWQDFERGRLDEATYLRRMFRDGREVDGARLRDTLRASYRWVDGAEPLLAELASTGAELHALSNYPVWYHLIDDELGLSRYLEWSFVSWDTGVRKPDPRAWTEAARRLDAPLEALVFVDDSPRNVAAAAELGVDAIRFTTTSALRTALVERGLL